MKKVIALSAVLALGTIGILAGKPGTAGMESFAAVSAVHVVAMTQAPPSTVATLDAELTGSPHAHIAEAARSPFLTQTDTATSVGQNARGARQKISTSQPSLNMARILTPTNDATSARLEARGERQKGSMSATLSSQDPAQNQERNNSSLEMYGTEQNATAGTDLSAQHGISHQFHRRR